VIRRCRISAHCLQAIILRGLRRHHIPATGFIDEGKVGEIDRPNRSRR
jgi:hypothetical protein